jgi:molybdopterin-biosynthesis enzyme MoeA-like protein
VNFGIIIIGDEILSGKRQDKHLAKAIELLSARGLKLSSADYVGDEPDRITHALTRAFGSGDVVFSFGGIGATPDDHTRHCAARALGREMELHPQAKALILERMQDIAREQALPYEPDRADNTHRLNMGVFPKGAQIIPNPFNKIAGFYCSAASDPIAAGEHGGIYFLPGFPVMAHPMMAWVLDTHFSHLFLHEAWLERSVIVYGAMEATLTPLMEAIERDHAVKVFSLPSVDHPEYGRHIELGVKGSPQAAIAAYAALLDGLRDFSAKLGPELVRE